MIMLENSIETIYLPKILVCIILHVLWIVILSLSNTNSPTVISISKGAVQCFINIQNLTFIGMPIIFKIRELWYLMVI